MHTLRPRATRSLDGTSFKVPADESATDAYVQSVNRGGVLTDAIRHGRSVPGPGHYDTSGSPYANALPRDVAGPNSFAAPPPLFELFPTGDPDEVGFVWPLLFLSF